jgi:hypothetical protein
MRPYASAAAIRKATPREVVSKILYLRDRYHFGPGRAAAYLKRFHQLTVARSTIHRILICYGVNRLPANQKRRPMNRLGSGTRNHNPDTACK